MQLQLNPYAKFIPDKITKRIIAILDRKSGVFLSKRELAFLSKKSFDYSTAVKHLTKDRVMYLIERKILIPLDTVFLDKSNEFRSQCGWMNNFDNLENQKILEKSHILILGCSQVSIKVIQCLFQLGIRNFVLIDNRIVDNATVNSDSLFTKNDIGKSRTSVILKKLQNLRSKCTIQEFYDEQLNINLLSDIINSQNKVDMALISDIPNCPVKESAILFIKNKIPFTCGSTGGTELLLGPTYSPDLKNKFLTHKDKYFSLLKQVKLAVPMSLFQTWLAGLISDEFLNLLTHKFKKVKANRKAIRYDTDKKHPRYFLLILSLLIILSGIVSHSALFLYSLLFVSLILPLSSILSYGGYFCFLIINTTITSLVHQFPKIISGFIHFTSIIATLKLVEECFLGIILGATFKTIIFMTIAFVLKNLLRRKKYRNDSVTVNNEEL